MRSTGKTQRCSRTYPSRSCAGGVVHVTTCGDAGGDARGSRRRRKQKKFSTLLSRFCSPPRLPSFERFSVKFLKEALSLFSLRSFDFFTLNPIFRSQPLACVTLYDTGTPRGRRSPRSNKSRGAVEVRPPWCRWRPDQAERTPRLRRGVCT